MYLKRIMICLCLLMSLTACKGEDAPIVFADPGWDSARLQIAAAQFILEHAYNTPSNTVGGSALSLHEALVNNQIDVHMEVWSENIPPYAADRAAGNLQEIGVSFEDNQSGFYVPRYVIEGDAKRNILPMAPQLRFVQDLKKYSHVFRNADNPRRGLIYGPAQEWAIGAIIYNKFIYYRFDQEYDYSRPASGEDLTRTFVKAYEKGEAIVGYYWTPSWLLGAYDFVLLKDAPYTDVKLYKTGATECPSVRVVIAVSNKFAKQQPEISQFLCLYRTSSAALSQALHHMHTSQASLRESARWFLREHDNELQKWLGPQKAERVRKALAEEKGN